MRFRHGGNVPEVANKPRLDFIYRPIFISIPRQLCQCISKGTADVLPSHSLHAVIVAFGFGIASLAEAKTDLTDWLEMLLSSPIFAINAAKSALKVGVSRSIPGRRSAASLTCSSSPAAAASALSVGASVIPTVLVHSESLRAAVNSEGKIYFTAVQTFPSTSTENSMRMSRLSSPAPSAQRRQSHRCHHCRRIQLA